MKRFFRENAVKFGLLFLAVVVFTGLDWLVHQSNIILAVPSWYFTNKLVAATLLVWAASIVVRRFSPPVQAAIIAVVTSTLLEIRYMMYGYSLTFHEIVLPWHAIFLFGSTWIAIVLDGYISRKYGYATKAKNNVANKKKPLPARARKAKRRAK